MISAAKGGRPSIGAVRTITLDDPELAGTYTVEPQDDDRLVLEPVMSSALEIMDREGLRPLTQEEDERLFGDLPRDGEG
jgi:hypothetical protein